MPSKHEAKQVVKYVRMIRAGKILFPAPQAKPEDLYNYDVWEKEHDVKHRGAVPIAAPKPKLPGHAESYNPPQVAPVHLPPDHTPIAHANRSLHSFRV